MIDRFSEFVVDLVRWAWRPLVAVTVCLLPFVLLATIATDLGRLLVVFALGASLYPLAKLFVYVDKHYPQFSPLRFTGDPPWKSAPPVETDRYSVHVGNDIYGQPVYLSPKEKPGLLATGEPGSGKTVFVKMFLANLRRRGAELTIIDLKNGGDFRPFAAAGVPLVTDLADAVEALEAGVTKMRERQAEYAKAPEDKPVNFWQMPHSDRGALIVYAIDEVQQILDTTGAPKDEKELMERAARALTSLVKLGRSAGVFTVVATQKSDAKAIPTNFRDQIPVRISGRQNTREAARAALGELRDDDPRPDDFEVLPPGLPGRFVVAGVQPWAFVMQGFYLNDAEIKAVLTQ